MRLRLIPLEKTIATNLNPPHKNMHHNLIYLIKRLPAQPRVSLFLTALLFCALNSLTPQAFSHLIDGALRPKPSIIEQTKKSEHYKIEFSYYTISSIKIVDLTVNIKDINTGAYYDKDVSFQIRDEKGETFDTYQPYLDSEHNFKTRPAVKDYGKYTFILRFNDKGIENQFEFPFEVIKEDSKNICYWCSMSIENCPTIHYLHFKAGKTEKTCCAHCALDVKNRYNEKILAIETDDYRSAKKFDISKGWFALDSDMSIENSMPPFVFPFDSKEEAEKFQKTHGGKIVDYKTLAKQVHGEDEDDYQSNEFNNLLFLEDLFNNIAKNYYKDVEINDLVNKSIEAAMGMLDKDSRLKKIEPSSLDFIRGFDRADSIKDAKVLNNNIGYIKIAFFGRRSKEDFTTAMNKLILKKIKGLIIDLRDNPGGNIDDAAHIIGNFTKNGTKIATISTRGKDREYIDDSNNKWNHPLAILINNSTASSAEMFAASLRFHAQATLIGKNSYGKNTIQKAYPLNNEHTLFLTTGKYRLPNNEIIENKGVTPDYKEKDPEQQLAKAVDVLQNMIKDVAVK